FERDGEIHALQLHARWHLQRAGREVQDGLDASADDEVDHLGRGRRRHGKYGDADAFALDDLLQLADVMNRHPAARVFADLRAQRVEQRRNLEPFLLKAGIVGQRESEVAGADDRHAQLPVEAENLAQMPFEIADVIADATHAELAEIREVFPDLRGVEMKL